MYLLFTDETNLTPDLQAKFFVYGGLFFPVERLIAIDMGIAKIRDEYGYRPSDPLKFDTRSRPDHVSFDNSTKAKEEVIQLCIKQECKFIAYVALHAIIKNAKQYQIIHNGANHVIGRFNKYLHDNNDFGICVVDRLSSSDEYKYLVEKFCLGLDFLDSPSVVLDRVKLFTSSCNNASHASSAMDIVLGSFRYCINQPKNIDAAKKMMLNIVKMIWHTRVGENIHAMDKGLIFRPKEIQVPQYKAEYKTLLDHINALIAEE